ncbi:MAG: NAD-dependent DNA ligase LigA [Ichthyobacteriaceae bacterium]|nr:NAD-dependent DNA ligase LigA [Ichthyobacteriaceae bacterium]
MSTVEQNLKILREELHQHNYNYYILDKPELSDFDFDMKLRELQTIEKKNPEFFDANSPTQRVGGGITKKFSTVTHTNRMYSLDNAYSYEELADFETRVRKIIEDDIEFVCELKYDGASISITYKNGKLLRAVTRGDGFQGDDVTTNIRTIKSVPLELRGNFPDEFDIRGEIVFPTKEFEQLNNNRVKEGLQTYANPRNLASGTLKMQDSTEVAKRPLECLLYNMVGNNIKVETQFDALGNAENLGFKVPNISEKAKNMAEVIKFIEYWDVKRRDLEYETDGVVVKINSLHHQAELGYTAKSPRWAIAYKFKAETKTTLLNDITYQVGRTGAVTPVANLNAVELAGTIVKRASLHNSDQITKLDVRVGDYVFVEKGGEIIPKIVGVDLSKRTEDSVATEYIKNCPECGAELVRKENEAIHYCPNQLYCPPQIVGRIEHFISRKAMDIDGLGRETIEQLFRANLISNYSDLYTLKDQKANILILERMAQKSVNNMLASIEESKNQPFEKVLFALGIRHVGETVAKKLANYFKSLSSLENATFEELIEIDEIGEIIAKSVVEYFSDLSNIAILQKLQSSGLQFIIDVTEDSNKTDLLKDKAFVVSGIFTIYNRNEIKDLIEKNGGVVKSSISKKTDYVLAGDKMGPSKLEKAEKLSVPVISEEDFKQMIE